MMTPRSIRDVLTQAHAALDAFSIVAASMTAEAIVEGPVGPTTRSLPELVAALQTIDGELTHQIGRLLEMLRNPQPTVGWDADHYLRLAGGYADARRHLRILANYVESRLPKAITTE